jgi:flagellar protein FliL
MANAAIAPQPKDEDDDLAEEAPPVAPKGVSLFVFIGILAILTALGIGSGGLLGLHLKGKMESAALSKAESAAANLKGPYPPTMGLKPVPPIVANLSGSERSWIRIEAALVMENDQSAEAKILATQVTEDMIAFLRTVPLTQIQGASGFQHLREDLNERARVRSGGKVQDVIIQALIIE